MFHRLPADSSGSSGTGSGRLPDYRHVAPPAGINRKKGYTNDPGVDLSLTVARQKRVRLDDEYFDDDDDDEANRDNEETKAKDNDDEEEDDPLDAFMAGLEKETTGTRNDKSATKTKTMPMSCKTKDLTAAKGIRGDIDEEDTEESYYKYMSENPNAGIGLAAGGDDDDEEAGNVLEYDKDGNPIYNKSASNVIDPLPPIDHSAIKYDPFRKDFYDEHEEIKSLSRDQVASLRKKLCIRVFGSSQPKPVCSFAHFNFDHQLMKAIIRHEYTTPTSIQSQGIPIALSGRDLIGIAKTGSGKTAAFLLPLMVHIMDQRDLKAGEGPIGLILAPTRELVQQIYSEAKKFAKVYNIAVVCVYGGGNRWEQMNDLTAGCEIVVATPGRMIDMIKSKATNLQRVTCLILDEADRMFDMGFEPQVRSICNHVRPDRQTMLFSATFKKRIEKLASDVLTDPLKIIHGESGEANADITQVVKVMPEGPAKWDWLTTNLIDFMSQGSVLIFVTKKAHAEELAANLIVKEFDLLLIHGDMDQNSRNSVITSFKRKEKPILVATDVAARGLDIPHVRTVINYDVARDIDTHTHRIGRTGRAGEKGFAYTLVTDKDKEFVGHLVRNLESANQTVNADLMDLAMKSSWFKNSRYKNSSGSSSSSGGGHYSSRKVGGSGLGFKSRPPHHVPPAAGGLSSQTYSSMPPPSQPPPSSSSASASEDSGSRSGNSRVAQMRAAYASNYTKTFKAASSDNNWTSSGGKASGNPPAGDSDSSQQQRRSRWN